MPSKPSRRLLLPLLHPPRPNLSLSIATLLGATRTHNLLDSALTTSSRLLPLWLKYFPFRSLRVVEWTSLSFKVIDFLFVLMVAMMAIVGSVTVPDATKVTVVSFSFQSY
jgi:hypothetical protein